MRFTYTALFQLLLNVLFQLFKLLQPWPAEPQLY